MRKLLFLSLFVGALAGCSSMKSGSGESTVSVTGKLEKLGITTFQYGTHQIKSEGKSYALKSADIVLDKYLDKNVTIKGTKVAGYPLEGGPDLIEVTAVRER
ncbi:hypothetical protein ACJVDH_05325 [Pedobacter sp. AW1-32]|uniref:hypothetical protein n=1 Tax=Pedobacter sp. AW1-32 TaxID=3383026 RepID=UPI003FEF41DE